MPVIRVGDEQKNELDKFIEERFAANVSYRVAVAELLDYYKSGIDEF